MDKCFAWPGEPPGVLSARLKKRLRYHLYLEPYEQSLVAGSALKRLRLSTNARGLKRQQDHNQHASLSTRQIKLLASPKDPVFCRTVAKSWVLQVS